MNNISTDKTPKTLLLLALTPIVSNGFLVYASAQVQMLLIIGHISKCPWFVSISCFHIWAWELWAGARV